MTAIWSISQGEALEVLQAMESNSCDGLLSDPPSGIGFMGAEWDKDKGGRDAWIAWLASIMREAFRVLKPGAHGLVWSLPRTSHWTGLALEQAGFEVRDTIDHIFACLSEDTEILTQYGWQNHRDVVAGSLAMCYHVSNDTFSWGAIEGVHVYPFSDTAIRLRGDRTDQIVTPNHRCVVERGGRAAFEYAAALECQETLPVLEDLPGLLRALPLPHQGAGHTSQDLLVRMCGRVCAAGQHRGKDTARGLPALRQGVSAEEQYLDGQGQALLEPVRSSASSPEARGEGAATADRPSGESRVDGGEPTLLPGEDVRGTEPGLEGWGHAPASARGPQGGSICAVSGVVLADGKIGRVRDGTSPRRGAGDRSLAPEVRGGPPRQPRPDGQQGGEPDAVRLEQRPQEVRGSRFTRPDLVRVEREFYRGVVWCVTVPTGAFVARRNGKVFVTGNSGFPKSLDVSKAIDASAGAERKVVGLSARPDGTTRDATGWAATIGFSGQPPAPREIAAPATQEAALWSGYGTALKPAKEVWWLVRKPLAGTVAQTAIKHGTGGINIDGTRIPSGKDHREKCESVVGIDSPRTASVYGESDGPRASSWSPQWRWLTNVVFSHSEDCDDGDCVDGCPVALLDQQSGIGGQGRSAEWQKPRGGRGGIFNPGESSDPCGRLYAGVGGASRFFFCAKPSRRERDAGCEHLPKKSAAETVGREEDAASLKSPRTGAGRTSGAHNYHPTVKSIALATHFATLILPPKRETPRRLLVVFAGSGTEVIGGALAGWEEIDGIEREAGFVAIARARCTHWIDRGLDQRSAPKRQRGAAVSFAGKTKQCNVCGNRTAAPGAGGRWPDCEHNDWSWVDRRAAQPPEPPRQTSLFDLNGARGK